VARGDVCLIIADVGRTEVRPDGVNVTVPDGRLRILFLGGDLKLRALRIAATTIG
jgi:hypothetical protein